MKQQQDKLSEQDRLAKNSKLYRKKGQYFDAWQIDLLKIIIGVSIAYTGYYKPKKDELERKNQLLNKDNLQSGSEGEIVSNATANNDIVKRRKLAEAEGDRIPEVFCHKKEFLNFKKEINV